jgi:hypothetical protein
MCVLWLREMAARERRDLPRGQACEQCQAGTRQNLVGLLPRIGWRSAALDQSQLREARRQVRRPSKPCRTGSGAAVAARLHCGGQRFESPQLHQEVRANRRDFLVRRIARHSRDLRRHQSVCQVYSTVCAAHWRCVRSKVSGRKIPFPGLLFAT